MSQNVDKFIKLLSQTDGRDKIYKFLANFVKILAWQNSADNKATAKTYEVLAKSLGEGRSLLRIGKFVGNINKLQGYVPKLSSLTMRNIIEIFRVIGDFGYVFGDNVQYMCKYKVLPFDQKRAQKQSKTFQWYGFFFAVLLDIQAFFQLQSNTKLDEAQKKKERNALALSFVKDFCDLLAVTASVGYFSNVYKPNSGFTSACGVTSGAIATYNNWNKLK